MAKNEAEYAKIGRAAASLSDAFADKKSLYRTAFIKGLFSGFGSVLGATLLVAILLALLSSFKEIPLLGPVSESIKNTVQSQK